MCRQWVNMDLFSGPNTYTNDLGQVGPWASFFFFFLIKHIVCVCLHSELFIVNVLIHSLKGNKQKIYVLNNDSNNAKKNT